MKKSIFIALFLAFFSVSIGAYAASEKNITFKTLSESDYEKALSKTKIRFDFQASLGPVAIKVIDFKNNRSVTDMRVYMKISPDIPNINLLGKKMLKLDIKTVLDKKGRNIYRHKNTNSKADKYFQIALPFPEELEPEPYLYVGSYAVELATEPHFYDIQTFSLRKGIKVDDIDIIRGEVTLTLPIKVEAIKFEADEMGDVKETKYGNKILVKKDKKNNLLVNYNGETNLYTGVIAYDENLKKLQLVSASPPRKKGGKLSDSIDFTYGFNGNPAIVDVFVAEEIREKKYPFILGKVDTIQ